MRTLHLLLIITACLLTTNPSLGKTNNARKTHSILVQPVIVCDDDGSNPARSALPSSLIDQAYSRADLTFYYLPAKKWNHSKARKGQINLNTIVSEGRRLDVISKDPRVLTLLFVTAVDGHPGPLGRGLQNGNICFVCLGKPGRMTSPSKQAFVVAHEIGHCLNLKHVVDDPKVPNDIPNLEGDGPFEKRIAPEGLHPTQITTIKQSPLYLSNLHFYNKKEAITTLLHDTWGNNPFSLHDSDIRFQLNLSPNKGIPTQKAQRKQFIEVHFSKQAQEFTPEEKNTLTRLTTKLDQMLESSRIFGGKNNRLTKLPWHFLKVNSHFCNGYPHTRGVAIVLNQRVMKMMAKNEERGLKYLLHEKMHVLQRLAPSLFTDIYQQYGFTATPLAEGETARLQLITNPDTPPPHWALKFADGIYLQGTKTKVIQSRYAFQEVFYPLQLMGNTGNYTALAAIPQPASIMRWKQRFPISTGFDDPREIHAYLSTKVFITELRNEKSPNLTKPQTATLKLQRKHLAEALKRGSIQ